MNKIITERALIEVTPEGLELKEVFEGFTVQDVIDSTEASLIVKNVKENVQIIVVKFTCIRVNCYQ